MNHDHKFFLFETKATFELYDYKAENPNLEYASGLPGELYQRIEYAILACGCGEVIRTKVRKDGNNDA